jgi:hypothetical protein
MDWVDFSGTFFSLARLAVAPYTTNGDSMTVLRAAADAYRYALEL